MNKTIQNLVNRHYLNEGEDIDEKLMEDDDVDESLLEDELFEDGEESASDKQMSEEDLKIESLKIATNIAKLMSDVTTDDVIKIAGMVSDFIRNHEIGAEEAAPAEEPAEEENADEDLGDLEIPEEGEAEEEAPAEEEIPAEGEENSEEA